jgi:hypothetical protein
MAATPRDRTPRSSARRDWNAEYAALSARDRKTPLDPADLEQLGITAYLAGREPVSIDILTRAHTAALERGETRQAARSAFWIAFALIGGREVARAAGWGARGRRLLEPEHVDCVECGLLMLPQALEHVSCGDLAGAEAVFAAAERIGERFADADLTSLARQGRGRVLVGLGRVAEGVALFDEVMVAVTAGEVTPIVAGTVYCSVISACFEMLDIRRAQEWTAALSDWCEAQPGRAMRERLSRASRRNLPPPRPILQRARRRGARDLSSAQRRRARRPCTRSPSCTACRERWPRPKTRLASAHGRATHPGLALLRLAQGQPEAARADRSPDGQARARPAARRPAAAATEVFLASGDVAAAGRAAEELNAIAGALHSEALRAMAAGGRRRAPADGQAHQALAPLRAALAIWRGSRRAVRRRHGSRCWSAARAARSVTLMAHGWSWRRGRYLSPVRRRAGPRGRRSAIAVAADRAPQAAAHSAGNGSASAGRPRQDEPRHRERARHQRQDRGSPRQRLLRQAGSLDEGRRDRLRLYASPSASGRDVYIELPIRRIFALCTLQSMRSCLDTRYHRRA